MQRFSCQHFYNANKMKDLFENVDMDGILFLLRERKSDQICDAFNKFSDFFCTSI